MRDAAENVVDADAADDAVGAELERVVPERFAVRDAESANWVVRRVVEAERRVADAKAWLAREVRRAERERGFFLRRFGAEVEAWARRELAKAKGRRKSIDLPGGRVGYRARGATIVVADEAAALAWARRHCRPAVVTTHKLSKAAVNEHFERTGELPDGTHVEPAGEVFFIK